MADDDFDIDIYGDTTIDEEDPAKNDCEGDLHLKEDENGAAEASTTEDRDEGHDDDYVDIKVDSVDNELAEKQQQIQSTDNSGVDHITIPKQAPREQGVKRKEGSDDRPVDPGATTALLISDLHWWSTDDDIRGWINQAQCEDELKDITFSEHKVNGKSKGQAYVEFSSQQAATAAKRKIDTFGEGQQYMKKHTVTYSNPNVNPFRTLPKDAPMRSGKEGQSSRPSGGNFNDRSSQNAGGNFGNNFRGRGGYNSNRGNLNNMGGGFNRNFSGPGMGNMNNSYQPSMSGFQGSQFGNFNRGGMMNNMRGGSGGMRGGRGGLNSGMMGGIPMGGMPMGSMPPAMAAMGPMSMGRMGGGMQGPAFSNMQPHFNPAFFQQNQGAGGDWQNPHGAKRPRPE